MVFLWCWEALVERAGGGGLYVELCSWMRRVVARSILRSCSIVCLGYRTYDTRGGISEVKCVVGRWKKSVFLQVVGLGLVTRIG